MKVYFFPGVGADASLAPHHPLPGHDAEWIRWPEEPGRTWDEFESNLLASNRIEPGAVLIGISFGGMAAQAVAQRVKAAGIILVGSCRSSGAVAPWLRVFRPFLPFLPAFLFDMRLAPRGLVARMFGIRERAHIGLLFRMGARLDSRRFKRINALALRFRARDLPGIPVFSIHGSMDRIIPAGSEPRDLIIEGGGHLISMSHPDAVNAAILGWLGALAPRNPPGRPS